MWKLCGNCRGLLFCVFIFALVRGHEQCDPGPPQRIRPEDDAQVQACNEWFAHPRERNEFRGERGGGGWPFGAIKNIAIIAILVALIVLPKSWIEKRKRAGQVTAG